MRRRKYFPKVNEMAFMVPALWTQVSGNSITPLFYQCHLFDGTIIAERDSSGQPIKYHYNLGFQPVDIKNAYVEWYGERRLGKALPPVDSYIYEPRNLQMERSLIATDQEGYEYLGRWLNQQIQIFIDSNKDKYLKLVDTIGFKYDPISNYDMTEEKTAQNGTETLSHTVDKKGKTLNFESNQVDLVAPTEGEQAYDQDAHVSSWTSDGSDTSTTTQPVDRSVEHQTTTYDSATYRNEWKETSNDGSQSQTVHLKPKASESVYNGEEYTDTKDRGDDSYQLSRKGNIGVTTSQQMIESEREVARYNVLKEFFEDLNRYLLLSTWD